MHRPSSCCACRRCSIAKSEFHNFSPLAADDLPLFMATSWEKDPDVWTGACDVFARAASISGYSTALNTFVEAPRYNADIRRPGAIDLITLWPFKLVEKGEGYYV